MIHKLTLGLLVSAIRFSFLTTAVGSEEEDAHAVVDRMFNYMRGKASVSTVEMIVHRPNWQRTMAIKAWTEGLSDSYFVITSPPKDEGNGTLKKGVEMWVYNPKVNRVIKLPPSMMSQSWMGSDFSNNDIAKSTALSLLSKIDFEKIRFGVG